MRADGLSRYGNPRPTSPAIDGLAERGVLFEQAISNAPWTLPSFIGLLSGSYASRRVFDRGKLVVSLVGTLRDAGWATAAFTEGGFTSRRLAPAVALPQVLNFSFSRATRITQMSFERDCTRFGM